MSVSKYVSGGLVSEAYTSLVLDLGFGIRGVGPQGEIVLHNVITNIYHHTNPIL